MDQIRSAALTHEEIISRLRGQTLRVTNLKALFSSWPNPSLNQHYTSLRTTVDEAIAKVSTIRPSSQRRQNDDLALLTSLSYPKAAPEELKTLALYVVWLVCWDDEVDANEGDLAGDFAKAEAWRNETLQVLSTALGLASDQTPSQTIRQDPLHDIITTVGQELQAKYTRDQNQHVFDKIALFVHNCATEQKIRLDKIVPNYESYMAMRTETVAGDTLCSLIEFSHSSTSASRHDLPAARVDLDKQVSILLSLLNDLLSLKKELRTDCVINAVAALMAEDNALEGVVADIIAKMEAAVASFDRVAEETENSAESEGQRQSWGKYVDGCRSIVTGVLEFTLKSPRYKLASLLAEDGSLEITL
ncbi:terpenoid synthase [Sarocladium strictum]